MLLKWKDWMHCLKFVTCFNCFRSLVWDRDELSRPRRSFIRIDCPVFSQHFISYTFFSLFLVPLMGYIPDQSIKQRLRLSDCRRILFPPPPVKWPEGRPDDDDGSSSTTLSDVVTGSDTSRADANQAVACERAGCYRLRPLSLFGRRCGSVEGESSGAQDGTKVAVVESKWPVIPHLTLGVTWSVSLIAIPASTSGRGIGASDHRVSIRPPSRRLPKTWTFRKSR